MERLFPVKASLGSNVTPAQQVPQESAELTAKQAQIGAFKTPLGLREKLPKGANDQSLFLKRAVSPLRCCLQLSC